MASGSVTISQEAMVLGGVLSGAYYASNTHIQKEAGGKWPKHMATNDMPAKSAAPGIDDDYDAANMNFYCAKACMVYGADASHGRGGKAGDPSNNAADFNKNTCEEHCGIRCISSYNEGDTVDIRDGDWCRNMTGFTIPPAGDDAAYFRSGSLPSGVDKLVRTANSHFAGGMVYEMIQGPLSAICSGNRRYFEEGGVDFDHSDGVDSHAVFKNNLDFEGAPPERLLCMHRHAKPDLFMRVGSTSPIVINGGLAF
ncbi:MAG: hypothetical protein AAB425_09455 [Bdellovibrionota bacterium]